MPTTCSAASPATTSALASTAPARPAPVVRSAPIVRRDYARLPGASRYLSATCATSVKPPEDTAWRLARAIALAGTRPRRRPTR
jgi:hypothetical protein